MNKKIESFTDLLAWQKAHQLVLSIYKVTRSFPSDEVYGLTNQIRRASISTTSNLAEGFSRKSQAEKKQFYYISIGSLTEVQNQLLISKDIGYLQKNLFKEIAEQTVLVSKLVNSLIKNIYKLNS